MLFVKINFKGPIMVVLANLIQRDQYAMEVLRASIRKSVFWQSGLIVNDMELTRLMNANVGSTFMFDYYNDLADNEGRISDDSATVATTDGITTGSDVAIGNYRNRSWGARNITANLSATGDPLQAIAGRIGAYWARQMDTTAIAVVNGIIAGNAANNAGDMINNKTTVSIDLPMVVDTKQTAGDAQDFFGAMICHSAIKTSLVKQGIVDKIYDAQGNFLYESFIGLRLVVTDSVPTGTAIPGGVAGDYLTYIVGTGMFGYGEGQPKLPNEVFYQPAVGNGAGEETLWSRKNFCIHPYGFSFKQTG
ncbi:MAG: hypothetical protein JHC33_05355, partial [Ignisphaera sp.]|nr:hypothetical protein [Ignisphaera sp.]